MLYPFPPAPLTATPAAAKQFAKLAPSVQGDVTAALAAYVRGEKPVSRLHRTMRARVGRVTGYDAREVADLRVGKVRVLIADGRVVLYVSTRADRLFTREG